MPDLLTVAADLLAVVDFTPPPCADVRVRDIIRAATALQDLAQAVAVERVRVESGALDALSATALRVGIADGRATEMVTLIGEAVLQRQAALVVDTTEVGIVEALALLRRMGYPETPESGGEGEK